MLLSAHFFRLGRHGTLAIASLVLAASHAHAHDIAPFKLAPPGWYIQVGWEYNPDFGVHPFVDIPPPPIVYWDVPARLELSTGLVIRAVGDSTHVFALHPGEAVPSNTFDFDIAVAAPGPPF